MDPATVTMANFLADLIIRVGFPIVVSGYLLFRLDKQVSNMIDAIKGIAVTNAQMLDKINQLGQHNQTVVQVQPAPAPPAIPNGGVS